MRLRHRRAALLATILTILLGAALASASASLLETALRLDAPPRGWARADLVVTGVEHAVLAAGEGKPAQPVTLRERSRVPDVRALITGVPGVDGIRPGATPGALVVDTAPGVDPERVKARAETALGTRPATVLTGDDRGRAEATGVAKSRLDLILVGGVFGGTELLVMAVLLAAIIGLAVTQRHREIALLRTIGATPRQVARTLRRQTLRPAVPAAVLGALLGPVLARALFERLQDKGVVPGVLQLSTSPFAVAAGALVTLLIVRACVGVAAWRAGRTPIREAVGDIEPAPGTVGRVRLALAGLCATAALSCAVTTLFMSPENAAATGGGTALAGALACAFVAPVLVDRLTRRFAGRTARLFGLPGELAAANVQARAGRSALLVIPLILVTAVALSNAYKQTTQAHGMREAYRAQVTADAVVTGDRITAREVAAARRVGPTSPLVRSQGWIEAPVDKANRIDPRGLIGLEPSAVRPQVTHGDIARLHGDAVALPEPLAADLGLTVGDRIGLVLGDGTHTRLRVVALLDSGGRYATLILPTALLVAHTTSRAPQELLVQGDRDRLAAALPGLTVRGPEALAASFDSGLAAETAITATVVAVILAYAALSLLNAVVTSLTGRRREFTLLRLAGATQRQLRQVLQAEALLVAVIGAGIGTVVALAALIPLSVATAGRVLPSGPLWVLVATEALAVVLVVLPTLVVSTLQRRSTTHAEAS